MNSKHSACPYAPSGCNYPEGECAGLCMPVQMHEPAPDSGFHEWNEIPTPTSPIGGWGWVFRIWNTRLKK